MLPLSRNLQTKGLDLVEAMAGVDDLISSLQNLRSEEAFSKLFLEATNLAQQIGVTLTMPRIASRSVYRPAAGETNGDVESYYRINYHFSTIDSLIQDLQLRFGNSQRLALNI